MTTTGKIIGDVWVFELIDETETCENWLLVDILEVYNNRRDQSL
jgi:hypothetical protein